MERGDGVRGQEPERTRTARLLGRRAERAVLDRLLAEVRNGTSRVLVVRGEAGVGKTALLTYATDSAADLTTLRAAGVQSEMELAFAALHQLCAPLLDRLHRIPAPQRRALATVFGLAPGPAPDRFMVGLAVLSLISDLAGEQPVLVVVDDAQWLDTATAQTLGFVARRIGAESVGLLFGAREIGVDLHGLPELQVDGLPADEAQALLGSAVEFLLDEPVRERIVAETGGNPLALLELPRGLTATQLAAGFGLLGGRGLPGRIEQSFLRQADALPASTRQLLLVAAAEPIGDPVLVRRAADQLGIDAAFAEIDGLLSLGERVTFRHPLVRSALYGSASETERRAVHLALAGATDSAADPDRRAWHLAAAAPGPDEDVAFELERSADRAQARGGFAAAAAFLQRAVALTRDPVRRTERALAGAHASLQAGAFETAWALLATAEAGKLDDLGRARIDLLRAEAAYAQQRGRDAPGLLLRAAKTLETLDVQLARDTYLDAWSAALFAGQLAAGTGLREVSLAAEAAPRSESSTRSSDVLLDGFALLFAEGRARAVPLLKQAAIAFGEQEASTEEVLRWGWMATAAAATAWDFEACRSTATRQVEVARAAGALAVLAVGVNVLGQVVALAGEFAEASSLWAEADAVREATGTHVLPYGGLVLAALRGRPDEAFPLIDETIASATAEGQGTAAQYARWARSVVLNGLGRHDEALPWAISASEDTPELFVSSWALSEQIEAAARSGRQREAAAALEQLQAKTLDTDECWGRGIEARARGLLDDGKTAEGAYLEAIEQLTGTRLRPDLARAHLLYGEWLRRRTRRGEARAELRSAYDLFTSIGMAAFGERARRELQATGETVRRRASGPTAGGELTPQEFQIASLVRDGLSNPEVGARLFLSPRTVEWHLRKIFDKLSISSRRQLREALPQTGHEATV
ncbi:ATP/maltotriose-dependent transcriptional regulator MalT [Kribbella sp. VKM Ac-2569]|uniref:ATP-binding protein n=1 Tax=Kribbella sp. VKM Ac-2569 TaxID=2512220 RepID=UPI0010D3C3E4|nr:LuxR family transcriptional regulator [Kribbella sp. VKM Ac-2569]RZT28018.1 ATP/maltotriose-dependent transcriptional regulator MalT [Kribbella sp. VKM Ac-2569]